MSETEKRSLDRLIVLSLAEHVAGLGLKLPAQLMELMSRRLALGIAPAQLGREIRIGIAIGPTGDYFCVGQGKEGNQEDDHLSDEQLMDRAQYEFIEFNGEGPAVAHMIVADVPLPKPQVIPGEIKS